MFSSLRSRIWLSYAVLIFTALSVVMCVLLLYLLQNPLIYRQTNIKLKAIEMVIGVRQQELSGSSIQQLTRVMERIDSSYDVRLILFSDREVVIDTRPEAQAISFPILGSRRSMPTVRDEGKRVWLYTLMDLPDRGSLMIAAPRPTLQVLTVFRNDLMPPVIGAGGIALILSLLLALMIARWIGSPLQRILIAARHSPVEQVEPVVEDGPREVKELTLAFNDMVERVQNTQQSQRDFVANVSHELKTPLTSIQGFSQAMLDGTTDTPEARQQAAQVIYDEAGRMHRMVLDLLDLARLEAGIADLTMSQVDLSALIHNVNARFTPQANDGGVSLLVETPPSLYLIGDGDRLAQVLINLVDNGLKNTPPGGKILIKAVEKTDQVEVTVSDTGVGIPEDVLPHIFDRFYQADKSRSKDSHAGWSGHSSGLGLAIVQQIVAAHGGEVLVRSQVGQGSLFTVMLPLAQPDVSTVIIRRK